MEGDGQVRTRGSQLLGVDLKTSRHDPRWQRAVTYSQFGFKNELKDPFGA